MADGTGLLTNFNFEAVDTLWEPFPPASQDVILTVFSAVLDLGVTVDPAIVWPGAQTTFQVTFTNSGLGRASMLWINLTLPPELTYVSDDAATIGGVLTGSYSYAFTDVAPGFYVFNLTVAALGGIANGTLVLSNFAMAGLDPTGVPLSGETQDIPVTLANAVLNLGLASSDSVAEPDDALTFTATLTNLGAASAESLTMEGSVDANATYVSSSAGGSYDALARLVRWNLGSLGPGSQALFAWTVSVDTSVSDGATIFARVKVESQDTSGTSLAPQEDSVQIGVIFASFTPVLILAPLTAQRGDELVATVYYNNTGSGSSGAVWLNWTLNGHYQLLALTPPVLFTTTADGFDIALPSVGSGPQRLDARLRVLRGLDDNLTMDLSVAFASTYRNGNPLDEADLTSAAIDAETL